jgi:Arc/MetJ-type ribon-helix-helix transcriptional regulator
MAVTLNPDQERIVNEEMRSGQYRSAEEVIWQALTALREKARVRATEPTERRRAVQDMLDFAERNRTPLQDISIKELIHTSVTSDEQE